MSLFDSSAFDLAAYFERIGYEGEAGSDLATLRAIALKHPIAIPFENLDPFFRRPVALDIESLQRKLIQSGRGGYCFEHNLVLGTALTAVGFDVTGLAARVMWNSAPGAAMPRSHMLLLVRVDGERLLVDAGFGGLTLTGPLRLAPGAEQETPHERFRLRPDGDGFVMEASLREWKPLYRFDLQPQMLADYEVTSWYLCHNPRSHFITSLIAARVDLDRRHALRNAELTTHHRAGPSARRLLTTPQELRDVLGDVFRIAVPADASFDNAFARIGTSVMPA